ncbi:DUF1735 domain-containing protein [Prevotella sp. A2879]|jgi:hypothetical protein|uniref:DUF1735 domain-containing protein n=1 Tax=Prevotella vespertina TaxID=2608404 RepID=A0A7C9HEC9_9BACT|nr:DUF1735 and LamG domain-containing protein [Prevotella vespertina]MUL28143.1 DUF1735 domain-containing protein [Prevotella vespertina]
MKHIFQFLGIASIACLTWSCANVDYDEVGNEGKLPNAIYIDGADVAPISKLTVDAAGGKASFTARAANRLSSNATLKFAVDEQELTKYNEANGTHYKLLPAKYYSLSTENLTIDKANISNGTIDVNVKPLGDDLDASTKYAIPVKIASVDGAKLLGSSSVKIFAIDRVLYTTALRQKNFYLKTVFPTPYTGLHEWTMSYAIKLDRNKDNQAVLSPDFYSRVTADGALQMKVGETDDPKAFAKTKLQPGKWYYIAWVYKNQHVRCYINGVLDNEFDVPKVETFTKLNMSWGAFEGYVREIRLYDKALTAFQIADNLYIETPDNPDLLFYAPLDKKTGIKDVSKKQNTIKVYVPGSGDGTEYDQSLITWSNEKFPE